MFLTLPYSKSKREKLKREGEKNEMETRSRERKETSKEAARKVGGGASGKKMLSKPNNKRPDTIC